jgi:hypothetical protein
VGDQFARLKKGDRFFYDLGDQHGVPFTQEQLTEVGGLEICLYITAVLRNIFDRIRFRIPFLIQIIIGRIFVSLSHF